MLKQGTLIRVKHRPLHVDMKQEDGSLWVIVDERLSQTSDGPGAYRCKSLATGKRWTWFADEFDTEENEDT